jgi:hypothetical protein
MLTHSAIPLAAAEVADNIDASYLQHLLGSNDRRVFDEQENGGRPFWRWNSNLGAHGTGFTVGKTALEVCLRGELRSFCPATVFKSERSTCEEAGRTAIARASSSFTITVLANSFPGMWVSAAIPWAM